MTKRSDEGNFAHFVSFSQNAQHLSGLVERTHLEADEFRAPDARPEQQADNQPAQPVPVQLQGRLVRGHRSVTEQDLQFVFARPVIRCGEICIHRLFLIELRQPFLHLGPLHVPRRIGFDDALLHQKPAETAQHRHVLVHRPRLQAPIDAVRLVPPEHRRRERRNHLSLAEAREIFQHIPIDVLRPR